METPSAYIVHICSDLGVLGNNNPANPTVNKAA